MGRIAALFSRLWKGRQQNLPLRVQNSTYPEIRNLDLTLAQFKSLTPGDVLPVSWSNQPLWKDWDTETAINDGLKASSWVYICITRNARAISSLPWVVEQKVGPRQYEPVEDTHPLQALLDDPNPWWSTQHLKELIVTELFLAGNSLVSEIKVKVDGQDVPAELWTVRPQCISPVPIKGGFIKEYEVTGADGKDYTVLPEDCVHIQFPDPACPYWGLSPLQSASKSIDTDVEASGWQKVSLQNMLIPPGAFLIRGHISKEQHELAKKILLEEYQGKLNAGKPLILGGQGNNEVEWKPLSMAPSEVSFIETRKLTREEICAIMGVPPPIVGLLERATYSNIRTARDIWWEDTLLPTANVIDSALTRSLAPEFGEDLRVRSDLSNVEALLSLFERRLAVVERLTKQGAPFNDAAEFMNLGFSFPAGDTGYLPLNIMPVDGSTGHMDSDEEKSAWFQRMPQMTESSQWDDFVSDSNMDVAQEASFLGFCVHLFGQDPRENDTGIGSDRLRIAANAWQNNGRH